MQTADPSRFHQFKKVIILANTHNEEGYNTVHTPGVVGKGSSRSPTTSYRDYQEVKIQEQVQKLEVGKIPRSVWAVLTDDLVDSCKPGDDVTVT